MTPKRQTGILFISYVTDLNLLEYLFYNYKFTRFLDILSICQLHILLSRTAQISLELHFCVELHTKKALLGPQAPVIGSRSRARHGNPNPPFTNPAYTPDLLHFYLSVIRLVLENCSVVIAVAS